MHRLATVHARDNQPTRPASESESDWEWVRKAASASEWDFFFSLSLSEKIFENTQYLHSVTFLASLHNSGEIDCSKRLAFLLHDFKLISNQQQLISKTDTDAQSI